MELNKIIYKTADNIATITLNDPAKRNSWDFPGQGGMTDQFYHVLEQARDDDAVKVIIIKGAGSDFSAGHDYDADMYEGPAFGVEDVKKGEGVRRASERKRFDLHRETYFNHCDKLFLNPKLTIAQVQGYCAGEGTMIMCECDFSIAAEDAQIGHPEQRMGFAGSSIPTIPHLILSVGLKRTLYLLLTGSMISGKTAHDWGMITSAVPASQLEEEVQKIAKAATLLPRDGIAIGKATRHLLYDQLGLTTGYAAGYFSETLFSNIVWEPDEYSFFIEQAKKGADASFKEMQERYKGVID
jgi:enoyl-CoA hydratase